MKSFNAPSSPTIRSVLRPWEQSARPSSRPALPPWADQLVDALLALGGDFDGALTAAQWPVYDWRGRDQTAINWAVTELTAFIPPRSATPYRQHPDLMDADVTNAAWARRCSQRTTLGGDKAVKLISRLAVKSLDTLDFLRSWREAPGTFERSKPDRRVPAAPAAGLLSDVEIRRRLGGDQERGLVITPLDRAAIGAGGVDVRLGNKFITFRSSDTASFDPLANGDDPRAMQMRVEKAWGEEFVLHPMELVLAVTLEYLLLPNDIGAQVITRSSLGRLGMITATAVVVNPGFRGCLTLELVNFGRVPIHLIPGARIAQLVLFQAAPAEDADPGRYDCPTEPEFSKIRDDLDLVTLRRMRERRRKGASSE